MIDLNPNFNFDATMTAPRFPLPLPPNLGEIFEHGLINTGDRNNSAMMPGDESILPYYGINQHQEYFDARLLSEAFLSSGRLDHTMQLMAYHPDYLEIFLRTHNFLLREDGPLPYTSRHYIAIMAASRYQCTYLMELQKREFLLNGGDANWLKGLDHAPVKLTSLYTINKILAHRPWTLKKEDFLNLTKKAGWSLSEVVHAVVLLAHFHSLSSFIHGCGITPEIDFDKGHTYLDPGSFNSWSATNQANITNNSLTTTSSTLMSPEVSASVLVTLLASSGATGGGVGGGGSLPADIGMSMKGSPGVGMGDVDSSNSLNIKDKKTESETKLINTTSSISLHHSNNNNNNNSHSNNNNSPQQLTPSNQNGSSKSTAGLLKSATHHNTLGSGVLAASPPKHSKTGQQPPSSTSSISEVETIMATMKNLSETSPIEDPEERKKRFENAAASDDDLVQSHEKENLLTTATGLNAMSILPEVSPFINDPSFTYEDFCKRGQVSDLHTFRIQDYSWEEHGYSLVNRLYADVGVLLDEKFRIAQNMTYYTMGGRAHVDTRKFRTAVWNYIQCLYGIRHDDYDYGEVNQLLERPLKSYIKTVCCFPERVSCKDYTNVMREFKHSEKVHVNLMIMEAKIQSEILYALRTLNRFYNL